MSFDSFREFLAMGGQGLYVWLSYGAAVIIILYNVASVRVAQRRFFQQARDRQRRHRQGAHTASAGGRPGARRIAGAAIAGESARS